MKRLTFLLVFLTVGCSSVGYGSAKYGKCYQCGAYYGHRGGNLPGQATVCGKCGGTVYYPPHKSAEKKAHLFPDGFSKFSNAARSVT